MLRTVGLAFLLVAMLGKSSRADVVGVGLDWRQEVFVQELWRDGQPAYRLISRRKEPVELRVHDRRGGGMLAGPWKLAPNQLLQVDAKPLVGQELVEWRLGDGTVLGLTEAPRAGDWAAAPKDVARTQYGLNGSGGRWKGMWLDLPSGDAAPGELTELTLHVPEGSGTFLWSKEKLEALSVTSDTLRIRELPNRFETDASLPAKAAKSHVVTVKARIPKTEAGPLLIVDGWRWTVPMKSGHGITVGVLIGQP